MAELLGKQEERVQFSERAQYYKNLFDPSTGFMRGKRNGGWVEPFDPAAVTTDYTEANAWQYSFFLPSGHTGFDRPARRQTGSEKKLDDFFLAALRWRAETRQILQV